MTTNNFNFEVQTSTAILNQTQLQLQLIKFSDILENLKAKCKNKKDRPKISLTSMKIKINKKKHWPRFHINDKTGSESGPTPITTNNSDFESGSTPITATATLFKSHLKCDLIPEDIQDKCHYMSGKWALVQMCVGWLGVIEQNRISFFLQR